MKTLTDDVISIHPLLSEELCLEEVKLIQKLQPFWSKRETICSSMFTLGTCAYLDAANHYQIYDQKRRITNPIIEKHFITLLEKVRIHLQTILNLETVYDSHLALPGFHIFMNKNNVIPSKHFDVQYHSLKWPFEIVDKQEVISFTLPLSIPKNGTGLNVWNVSYDDFMKLDQSKKRSLFEQAPDGFIDYKLGHLILHKGHILHQIKAPSLVEEGDLRITLQGHGILADGKIRIYW